MLTIFIQKFRRLASLMFLVAFTQFMSRGTTFLALERLNGAIEKIELSELVNIKFSAGNLCIEHDVTTLAIPLSEVKEYRFVLDNANNIEVVSDYATQDVVKVNVLQQMLYIKTSESSVNLLVSNLDGIIILNQDIDAGTLFTVDMSSWETGVYVVMLNGSSYKIIKQ